MTPGPIRDTRSLEFAPFAAPPDSRLELRICSDGAAQLRVPRYRLAGGTESGVRAFVYYAAKEEPLVAASGAGPPRR